jgi:membrane protein YqaA with SNARE-associated domain
MAIVEQIRSMYVKEEQRTSAGPAATGFAWRFEYTLLIGVFLLLTAFAIGFFYFSADIESLKSYGYAGLFLINLIGAASILLPSPAAASVVGAGALLEDFLGVPAFIWVGLVAGLGEAIGEFSGYAAGYGGRFIVEERPAYGRIRVWMEKRGFMTMFVMSTIPNPFFDVAGLAAGAVQMPLRSFFFAVLGGKVIKNTWLAAAGGVGAGVVAHLL